MVLTDDGALHERMLFLRDHGRLPGDVSFRSVEVAYKYKMSELQAALGRVQLARIDELIEKKREIFSWYAERLDGAPIGLNVEREHERATYWMVTAVFAEHTGVTADMVRDALEDANIATRPFFSPLSSLLAYADSPDTPRAQRDNPVSYDLAGARHQPSLGADPDAAPGRPRLCRGQGSGRALAIGGSAVSCIGVGHGARWRPLGDRQFPARGIAHAEAVECSTEGRTG